jgi:hypothetical protein
MSYKGWHSRGYLPHFDSAETVQFVTFRLADSLPRAVAKALADLPDNLAETDHRLDGGLGACWLKEPAIAQLVEDAILHFDGQRYRFIAWYIMPNHVHVVVEPIDGSSLGSIIHTWKSFSAKRFIRDEGHLARTIDYVENNPVKAGLVATIAAWPWSSGRLRA